jgi:iron complex transport system permease protein
MATAEAIRPRALPLGGIALLCGAIVLAGYNAASFGDPATLFQAWRQPDSAPIGTIQFLHAWLPRLMMSLLAGAGLALAGTVMQQVLRNPIASPLTLGVAAGSQLALSILTLTAPALLAPFGEAAAVAGGAIALAIVLGLTWHRGLEPVSVVLAGLVVSLYFGAVNAGLLLFFEFDLKALLIWGGGALTQHDWSGVTFLAPRVLVVLVFLGLLARPLAILTLDDHSARGLGLSLQRARLLALAAAVYLAAAIVSAVGIIAFVGLAAPALARQLGARTIGQRLLAAPAIGALLLFVTDQCVQQLDTFTTGLLPTGAVTALLGAPLLLWLLRQVRPRAAPMQTATVPHPGTHGPGRVAALWLVALAITVFALVLGRDATGWRLEGVFTILDSSPWRAPRVMGAACAGLLLALAGTVLQRLLRNPAFAIRFTYRPGDLVIFDNRRLLHARDAFEGSTGHRWLQGCYMERDEVRSRYRMIQRTRRRQQLTTEA